MKSYIVIAVSILALSQAHGGVITTRVIDAPEQSLSKQCAQRYEMLASETFNWFAPEFQTVDTVIAFEDMGDFCDESEYTEDSPIAHACSDVVYSDVCD